MKIELLYDSGSNCSQRVRWALNYKRIEYSLIAYNGLDRSRLIEFSPLGKVPALVVDGKAFAESIAILECIEEIFPNPPLLPSDYFLRAKVREAVEVVNGWVHPIQCSVVPRFFLPDLDDTGVRDCRKKWLEKTLPVLHDNLLFRDSRFAIGTEFSWADLTVLPIYAKALILGIPFDRFPKFNVGIRHCFSNDLIKESCPEDLSSVLIR